MAYFSNSSDGDLFYNQCSICKYGEEQCPIAFVQLTYNYDQCNNEVASNILSALVSNDGTCQMFELCKSDFAIDKNQLNLFD